MCNKVNKLKNKTSSQQQMYSFLKFVKRNSF